jgi:hypothetical protein
MPGFKPEVGERLAEEDPVEEQRNRLREWGTCHNPPDSGSPKYG